MSIESCTCLELKYETKTDVTETDTRMFKYFLSEEQSKVAHFLNKEFRKWLNATLEVEVAKAVTLDAISLQLN